MEKAIFAGGPARHAIAVFAGGCFWCTEAIFERLFGVKKVTSGYAGDTQKPSYWDIVSGKTNHAESISIDFDPQEISYEDLVYVFLKTHDPTTLNQQGADTGPQYRSIIFYADQAQKKIAEESVKKVQKDFPSPIVTEIVKLDKFFEAEEYHQDYYRNNSDKMYCKLVIDPKIEKLKKDFNKYLKADHQ